MVSCLNVGREEEGSTQTQLSQDEDGEMSKGETSLQLDHKKNVTGRARCVSNPYKLSSETEMVKRGDRRRHLCLRRHSLNKLLPAPFHSLLRPPWCGLQMSHVSLSFQLFSVSDRIVSSQPSLFLDRPCFPGGLS